MESIGIKFPPECQKELVVGNKIYRSVSDYRVSKADLEKSRMELKETEELRKESLKILKEMLSKDEDFIYRTDDAYLLRYLRYRKFNCQQTYKQLHKFFKYRNEIKDLFYTPSNIEKLLNLDVVHLMPYRDEDGNIIFIHKLVNRNTSEMSMFELLKIFTAVSDIITMSPHAQINGVIDMFDFGGTTTLQHSAIIHPSSLMVTPKLMQEMYPWRIRRVILLNCNAVLYAGFAGIRYLLKKKVADRFTLLRSDLSQVHKYIKPEILPKEYGGSLENSECYSYLKKTILGNKEYLKYEQSFICD